jgi:hypothetical protein
MALSWPFAWLDAKLRGEIPGSPAGRNRNSLENRATSLLLSLENYIPSAAQQIEARRRLRRTALISSAPWLRDRHRLWALSSSAESAAGRRQT